MINHLILALVLGDFFLMPHFQKHASDPFCKYSLLITQILSCQDKF